MKPDSIVSFLTLTTSTLAAGEATPSPPLPESFDIVQLDLPPAISDTSVGACTRDANHRGTGCITTEIGIFQVGDFTPDGQYVVATVEYVGAPAAPDPASIYSGLQMILMRTDGSVFANGDSWKCVTCGLPSSNAISIDPSGDYPHIFRSGSKALWGHNIVDCGDLLLQDDACTPNSTHIYPIHWTTTADGTGAGAPREMRLHPDDVHMGWSEFSSTGGQYSYFGRLEFQANPTTGTPLAPRYELVDVNLLMAPNGTDPITVDGDELHIHHDAITVGELRGFSGSGDEILYIGSSWESSNIDIFAVHVITGAVRRLTEHPDYVDPIAFSHDNQWFVAMDTRATDRQMWMSGLRWVPPLIDTLITAVAASTRNNGQRRFFQPILIDRYGDRDSYFGQQINAVGDGSDGSINDPNWNGRADPAFSPDGTQIVYWQTLVVSPACGDTNPLPCPVSTEQGGRTYRAMLARRRDRTPTAPAPVFEVPDYLPWAMPFLPGATPPELSQLPLGNFTLMGQVSGFANVTIANPGSAGSRGTVSVSYTNYCDKAGYVLNGEEKATLTISTTDPWENTVDWESDIVQTGVVNATKVTSEGGFHLNINVLTNIFDANGTLTTTIDGISYHQPLNGA